MTAPEPDVSLAVARLRAALDEYHAAPSPRQQAAAWAAYVGAHLHADAAELSRHPDEVAMAVMRLPQARGRAFAGFVARVGAGAGTAPESSPMAAALADLGAPDVPTTLREPGGYRMDDGGVWRDGDDGTMTQVAARPIVPIGRLVDEETGEGWVRMLWQDPVGGWRDEVVRRLTVADSRRLVSLAAREAPVTSITASHLVAWISAVEAASPDLPAEVGSRSLGWSPDRRSYLLGAGSIGGGPRRTYIGTDDAPGVGQWVAAHVEGGTWDGWVREVWHPLEGHPIARLMLYAAAAAPLLGVIPDAPSIVAQPIASTRKGKSVTLRAAASVGGNPARVMTSWGTTRAALTELAHAARHAPLVIDDTKDAATVPGVGPGQRAAEHVGGMVYALTSPVVADRSTAAGGLRARRQLSTVLLTSGEYAIAESVTDGGARARILSIHGAPITSAAVAESVAAAASEHYGHLLPRVVRWLDAHRSHWPDLVAGYSDSVRAHRERMAEDGVVAGSSPAVLAMLETAAAILDALGLRRDHDALGVGARAASAGGASVDVAREAMRRLVALTMERSGQVLRADWHRSHGAGPVWIGCFTSSGLLLSPAYVQEQMDRYYPSLHRQCLREWYHAGYIDSPQSSVDRGDYAPNRAVLHPTVDRMRVVCLTPKALALGGISPEDIARGAP